MLGTDGAGVGNPVEQVQLLDRDGINLVQSIDDWNVASALGFEDIDQVIDCGIATNGDICRGNLVFTHDSPDFLQKGKKKGQSATARP